MRTSSPRRSAITRTPSYLISNTQPRRVNGFSTESASMCFTWDARTSPRGARFDSTSSRSAASHAAWSFISCTVRPVITERGQRSIASTSAAAASFFLSSSQSFWLRVRTSVHLPPSLCPKSSTSISPRS